jgi:hypothetical protein
MHPVKGVCICNGAFVAECPMLGEGLESHNPVDLLTLDVTCPFESSLSVSR